MAGFGFRSVFSRLFASVFLALVVFVIAMFTWIQIVHNNSETLKHRAIARQIATQIDPFLVKAAEQAENGNRVQARFSLVVVKKSFDIFDESLNAKIGLYDLSNQLVLQTEDSQLPEMLLHETSWLSEVMPTLWGAPLHHIQVKTPSGFTIWYESRLPPKSSRFSGFFNLFTGTVLLFGIMTFVLWAIAKNMTSRLDEMSKQMIRMGEGDFSVRVHEEGNDEIALLARGFNQSTQKIEQLISANNLLLAHASHEFRTPITRMRLQTEMMAMLAEGLPESTKDKLDKRTSAINRDLAGLNDLIESILLVSRLDAGHALQQMISVDFCELVANECQHYPEATLNGQSVTIEAQPNLLTHLVRNLLNNALIHGIPPISVYVYGASTTDETLIIPDELLYSEPETKPEPSLEPTPEHTNATDNETKDTAQKPDPKDEKSKFDKSFFGRFKKTPAPAKPNFAVLAVIDQGEGIPVDKREDIFSPFVRLKQEKKGSGLGLSLVAQIVETHGGHILTDTWQGHTRFLVVLPCRQKNSLSLTPEKNDKEKSEK
ncbi:MAG: HAMP domain-containing sensor histidine kinase [Moraxella sp.]|nr:HAMP domain-containing sensor histidine kinase [Moraxella sp.]